MIRLWHQFGIEEIEAFCERCQIVARWTPICVDGGIEGWKAIVSIDDGFLLRLGFPNYA